MRAKIAVPPAPTIGCIDSDHAMSNAQNVTESIVAIGDRLEMVTAYIKHASGLE